MKEFKNIELLSLRDHFSVSFMTEMFSCSMKGVLKSVLKLTPSRKNRSPALLKGNILHKALECYFLKLKDGKASPTLELLSESFSEAIEYFEAKKEYYDEEVLQSAIEYFKSNTLLQQTLADFLDKNFRCQLATQDKIIRTELPFNKIAALGYKFSGRIDLAWGSEIIDFKSIGQAPSKDDEELYKRKMLKLRHEFCIQLLIYKRCVEAMLAAGTAPEGIVIPDKYSIVEVLLTKKPAVSYYEFTPKEVEKAESELQSRVQLVTDILKNKRIYRNYRDTMCPCEMSDYCMDEETLNMILSKLDLPKDFF